MVFNTTPTLSFASGHTGGASRRTGGQTGDAFVSFIASRTSATEDTVVATLTVADFGVKPGVNGSVTITVTDSVGDDAEYTAKYDSAVRTARALQETAMPMDLEATVEQRFKSFGGETMGMLGSFMVGVNGPSTWMLPTVRKSLRPTYIPMTPAASRFRVTSRLLQRRGWMTRWRVTRALRRTCCRGTTTW